jgi:hypothetical protein
MKLLLTIKSIAHYAKIEFSDLIYKNEMPIHLLPERILRSKFTKTKLPRTLLPEPKKKYKSHTGTITPTYTWKPTDCPEKNAPVI